MAFSFFERVPDGESISLWATGSRNIAGYAIVKKVNKADECEECIVDADGDDIDTLHDTTYGHLYETEKEATEAAIQLFDSEEKGWRDIVFIAKVEYRLIVSEVKPAPKPRPGGYTISQAGAYEDRVKPTKPPEAEANPDDALAEVDLDEDVGLEVNGTVSKIDPATLVQKATAYVSRKDRKWHRKADSTFITAESHPNTFRNLNTHYESLSLGETLTKDQTEFFEKYELR